MDEFITTVGDVKKALKSIPDNTQIYFQTESGGSLVEVTEVFLRLPKLSNDGEYIVFRAV